MSMKPLKGLFTLLAVGLMAASQWGCSSNNTTTNNNNNSGIPMSTLFPMSTGIAAYAGGGSGTASSNMSNAYNSAFGSVFSSISKFAASGATTWAIGMIAGINEQVSSGSSAITYGFGLVALSVNNQAFTTATVNLVPGSGTAIPLSYLGSSSYNGYNYSWYGSGSSSSSTLSTYLAGTSYAMSITGFGDTATSSLTAPGGYTFGYNTSGNGGVTTTVTQLGSVNAAFVYGFNGTTGSLTYQSTSPSNPLYPSSAYSLSTSPTATYITAYESASWTTTVSSSTNVKGGMIGVGLGIAESQN